MTREWRRPILYAAAAGVGFFLNAPMLIVVPMSFTSGGRLEFPPPGLSTRWYSEYFGSSLWTSATIDSFQVAGLTVLVATTLGTALALGLGRGRYPARGLVNTLVLSPIIVPIVILAIGIFFVFARWQIAGTMTGLVIAHSVLAIPLVTVTVGASLRTIDPTLETAAKSLGAGPLRTFQRITLPLILPGVLAGALFAFVISWDEVVIAIFLTSPIFRTLPVVMWGQVRTQIDPTIAVVATILMAVTTFILLLVLIVRWQARARGME
jgi:putative spermidine/putrescine transport system permease protein